MSELVTQVQNFTAATEELLSAINLRKVELNASVNSVTESEAAAKASELAAKASADLATEKANSATEDRIATGLDRIATGEDRVATGEDRIATGLDRIATGEDRVTAAESASAAAESAILTAADRVQTGLDRAATAADRIQTGLDRAGTAADRIQTGLDVISASNSATASGTNASTAQAQASLAAGHAAGVSGVVPQDLSGVNAAALHRSPNAITAMFVYDTSKDSDGGAWTEKCQHTSWHNEPLNGKWLGAQASEFQARYAGSTLGAELATPASLTLTEFVYANNVWALTNSATNSASITFSGVQAGKTYALTVKVDSINTGTLSFRHPNFSTTISTAPVISSPGTYTAYFTATSAVCYIRNSAAGQTIVISDFSVKEVIAQTTQTGDYFQLTTDGKFYKLNTGSGTTETFRGNKAKFPKLAGIVSEAGNVTIYDLTEPGRPMWKRFAGDVGGGFVLLSAYASSVCAGNSQIIVGLAAGSGNYGGLTRFNFASDYGIRDFNGSRGSYKVNFLKTSDGTISLSFSDYVAPQFLPTSGLTNAVAMTVLPDAPIDPITGLKVPTIAVATSGGVSVIKHNGTVSNYSRNLGTPTIDIDKNAVYVGSTSYINGYAYALNPGSLGSTFTMTTWQPQSNISNVYRVARASRPDLVSISETTRNILKYRINESSYTKSAAARITNLYNTGHLIGDIRRTYLSDITAGSASGQDFDRSYKAQSASITGTLTKSQVASNAQLVSYSGFSADNYLREPYSADLDFGTGEWSVGAWVNVPVSLPEASFPVVGSELVTNGDFSQGTTGWSLGTAWKIADGALVLFNSTIYRQSATNVGTVTIGKTYLVEIDVTSTTYAATACHIGGVVYNILTSGKQSFIATALNNSIYFKYIEDASGVKSATIKSISVREVGSSLIADRAHSSGARIGLGVTGTGLLTATAYDGTTTRTVTTTATYNTGTWCKAEAVYKTDGSLAIFVNGQEVAVTRGNPLLTLNNSNAVLTIGNSYALDAPFPGSIALLKISATAPTYDQAAWMYEQEKQLFRENAQCCLPDANAIQDLTYDDATDSWIAVSTTNESRWTGLVRTSVTPVSAGTYSKVSATSGVKMNARVTTNPGVDVTIPAYLLKEKLKKPSRSTNTPQPLDYVGGFTATTVTGNTAITSVSGLSYPSQTTIIGARVSGSGIPANTTIVGVSGTTIYLSAPVTASASNVQISFIDFILPVGYETESVLSAGAFKQEGSTKDWTRLFDGFRETVRFAVAPGYTTWVQINVIRSSS